MFRQAANSLLRHRVTLSKIEVGASCLLAGTATWYCHTAYPGTSWKGSVIGGVTTALVCRQVALLSWMAAIGFCGWKMDVMIFGCAVQNRRQLDNAVDISRPPKVGQ
eukprot:GILJ01027716.1.p1 GENE.GILJ01027716.1~~GILJ01027716.1.p1  ORF type:complete len:107 (-),score=0.34 GILJ01027716.1:344-664(-)